VKVTRFDPTSDLIIVKARIWGPGGKTPASLAVDTGSEHTGRLHRDQFGYLHRDHLAHPVTAILSRHPRESDAEANL